MCTRKNQKDSSYIIPKYSRFNVKPDVSDIRCFVDEYRERIYHQHASEDQDARTPFLSFAEKSLDPAAITWLQDNIQRFLNNTPNETPLSRTGYLTEQGYVMCIEYSPDGEFIIVGHSTGLIQVIGNIIMLNTDNEILESYAYRLYAYYNEDRFPRIWYPMFYSIHTQHSLPRKPCEWVNKNYKKFLEGTSNKVLYNRWYNSELGAMTALEYSPDGVYIIVGHASGMIQMRHGKTGTVMSTLRNIQFPPKPIYALQYSKSEERICYAACSDGIVYRIEIPYIPTSVDDPPAYCIRADPALECLAVQFYGAPGFCTLSTPYITTRFPALSLGVTADDSKIIVGYGDTSIKIYDLETREVLSTFKVHKLRLQFIPKKLQRIHSGQVVALCCHRQKPYCFASSAWDQSLRIWDTRCQVGCMMTFEGVNVAGDSIDLNRDHCVVGSWQPTDALTLWDLAAKKKLSTVRVQNRRPDVDGEYIYTCRYWNSKQYNRKGKYAIIGGSGTQCLEVINLHNRYISCSYPAEGTVLAVASHEDRIAFGGTAPVFNIVSFHEPKHEKSKYQKKEGVLELDNTKTDVTWFDDDNDSVFMESERLTIEAESFGQGASFTPASY